MKRTLTERIELFNSSDIYPFVSSNFCNGRDVLDVVASIARGGAKIIQLREKTCSDLMLFELTKQCKKITDAYNMLLIVDDRLDIAIAAGADGLIVEVHENPECAWSDGAQSLKPDKFKEMIEKARKIAQVIGRDVR